MVVQGRKVRGLGEISWKGGCCARGCVALLPPPPPFCYALRLSRGPRVDVRTKIFWKSCDGGNESVRAVLQAGIWLRGKRWGLIDRPDAAVG